MISTKPMIICPACSVELPFPTRQNTRVKGKKPIRDAARNLIKQTWQAPLNRLTRVEFENGNNLAYRTDTKGERLKRFCNPPRDVWDSNRLTRR